MTDEITIEISARAYDTIQRAKKQNEDYSDVIIRLVSGTLDSLQRRGEKEIVTRDNRRLILSIEQGKCMGVESLRGTCTGSIRTGLLQLGLWKKCGRTTWDEGCPGQRSSKRKDNRISTDVSLQSDYCEGCRVRRTNISIG